MDTLDFDWRDRNECQPFEDSHGNLYISVKSKYESFGGEKDARLLEAKQYGIDKLIKFYGKLVPQTALISVDNLYDAASTPDSFISPRLCVRMQVLVQIPKSAFDENTTDDATCDINKPSEGYLSAFISVENYERDIDYVTTSMKDFLPKMAKADKFMTNINIIQERKNLNRVKNAIRRYFNLNSVEPTAFTEEKCEADKQSQMEIGFSYDYKPVFALIDGNKHTIGYDCFLEESLLNHPTTANYLIQLGSMSSELTNQLSLDFDIFQFLSQHTYPAPVVETKKNHLDGLEKYDANGNLFSFSNLAKLITLDLDKKSCKDNETKSTERRIIEDAQTRRSVAKTSRQSKDFVGNWKTSTEGVQELKETLGSMKTAATGGKETIAKIYDDVMTKIDFGCVLEESLQCMLEEAITKFGTLAFEDPDLGQFFSADGAVEMFGLCAPPDGCDDELQLRVGAPAFQGITIPSNLPTLDYTAKTIDLALKQLYSILINSLVSLILNILDSMCKMISALPDSALAIGAIFGEGFISWLAKTVGVDVLKLKDDDAWRDAAISAGGSGFMGVVGNFSAKAVGSWDALVSGTGVSINLPNPYTGMVEEVFISMELVSQVISGIRNGVEDVEAILTAEEQRALLKGSAPNDVVDLAHECLKMKNPEMFKSREDVSYLYSALGEMVEGNQLENPIENTTTVTNVCDLGDGSDQDILRKNFLTSKDPLLSDSEVEELLSREKSRFAEKVKKAHKRLMSFRDGSIFPDFPSMFGSDDSLIPEAPPIISSAMATVSEGLYSSTINNFNVSMLQYAPLWKDRYGLGISGSLAKHSKNLMIDDTGNPIWLNLSVDDALTEIGYKISSEAYDDIDIVIEPEYEERHIGLYDWNRDFDAGKYTSELLNLSGEDDDEFGRMLYDAKIWDPVFTWRTEFIQWFVAPYSELDDWRDWAELIITIIGTFLIIFAAFVIGGLTMGASWVFLLSLASILVAGGLLNATIFMAVDIIIPELEDKVENEVTREEIECFHEKGVFTEAQWDDIEPIIDEVVDFINKGAITTQNTLITEIADYIEDDASKSNGSHEKAFIITHMLEDDEKKTLLPGTIVELVLKTETSGIKDGKNSIYTNAYIRTTPITSKEVEVVRPPGFSEVITSFERRGVRGDVKAMLLSDVNLDAIAFNASSISIGDLYDSGIELVEYDRVESKISNYYMENQSSLILGRKIPEPNLLKVRYSSTIDAPNDTATELLQSMTEGGSNLQEHHKRFIEIMEQTDGQEGVWQEMNTDSLEILFNKIWLTCMTNMAKRVYHNRMYKDEYLNGLDFEYPKQDVIGYKKVSEGSVDLTNSIMKLEFSNSSYCDDLSPIRRSGSITGLRLMVRTFIVERILNSIQVFDTFDISFMTSDMFKKAVFDDIKVEMNKYQNSFAATLEGKIFLDMKETASKYFEIEELLGNEVPEISSDKDAMLEIIKMEIEDMNTTIASQLRLDTFYHSSSWDDFVFETLLTGGEYSSPGGSQFKDEYVEFGSILDPYFKANTRYIDNNDGTFTHVASILYNGFIVIRAECEGTVAEETDDDCEPIVDYSKVKTLLFNNEIYQDLISYVFPLKDAATLLSTYHFSAITDPAVFKASEGGKHVTDLFAETKLSTLQTFLACLHGAKETTYVDPFLEKLKT